MLLLNILLCDEKFDLQHLTISYKEQIYQKCPAFKLDFKKKNKTLFNYLEIITVSVKEKWKGQGWERVMSRVPFPPTSCIIYHIRLIKCSAS